MHKSKTSPMAVACRSKALGVSVLLGVLFATFSATVWSEEKIGATYNLDIPAQKLGDALQALALATKHRLVYPSQVVDGKLAPAVRGGFTTAQAVEKLLAGSGLKYEVTDGLVVVNAGNQLDRQGSLKGETQRCAVGLGGASRDCVGGSTERNQMLASTADAEGDKSVQQGEGESHSNEDSENPLKLQEIVVTAQKRQEKLQNVPISISVLPGKELDRSTASGVQEMLNRVPGVLVDTSASGIGSSPGNLVAIRGAGAPGSIGLGPSTVGYYIDSVPFGFVRQAIVPDTNTYDMERVEVLRGPQGTLYGASSAAGVVRILTKDADLENFELKGRVIGSHTLYGAENGDADLAVNAPIIEGKLAARAVVGYQDLSGWIDRPVRKDANDQQQFNARLKINSQLTERLSAGVSAWISRTDVGAPPFATDGEGRFANVPDTERKAADFDAYGVKVNYAFPTFSLSSMTSYINYTGDSDAGEDPTGTQSFLFTEMSARTLTQEFNIASTHEGSWRWTAGAMYRDGEDKQFQTLYFAIYPTLTVYTSKSWAVFGELTRLFLDGKLELTAGLRYFKDDVGQQPKINAGNFPPPIGVAPDVENTFRKMTPRVILNWHPVEQATLYVSYGEGFRSGLHQNPVVRLQAPNITLTKPDLLKNYEVGGKGTFLGGRIGYDTAVYYMDWQDVQLPLGIELDGIGRTALVNGSSASGFGVDTAINVMPAEGWEVGINASWNNLEVDKDVFTFLNGANRLLFPKESRLNSSIETTVGVHGSYTFSFGGSYRGTVAASANWRPAVVGRGLDATFTSVVSRADPILTSRAAFTVDSPNRWSGTLFVDNLNNEQGIAYFASILGGPSTDVANYLRPRTIGLQFEYHFD